METTTEKVKLYEIDVTIDKALKTFIQELNTRNVGI